MDTAFLIKDGPELFNYLKFPPDSENIVPGAHVRQALYKSSPSLHRFSVSSMRSAIHSLYKKTAEAVLPPLSKSQYEEKRVCTRQHLLPRKRPCLAG